MALVLAHVADMAHGNGGKLGVLLAFAVAYRFRPMAVLGVGAIANGSCQSHLDAPEDGLLGVALA